MSILLVGIIVSPAYATRTVSVTKELDIKKDLLATVLEDPKNYKEIFPAIKDVKLNSNDKNQVKFVIDAMGRQEADVKLSKQPNGAFLAEILSGDLKGSKIITTLKERSGFHGEPNAGTTVKCTLALEIGFWISVPMSLVSDSQIETEVGNGFYKLSEYAKSKYPQNNLVNVDYKKNTMPKLEAAKKLDLQKEAQKILVLDNTKTKKTPLVQTDKETKKIQPVQTISEKRDAAKKLVTERNQQSKPTEIVNMRQQPLPQVKSAPAPLQNLITLDPLPATARIGDNMVFSGKLSLSGTNPAGATVYIKDEDPFGGDDLMASGIVDASGRFYISWTVRNMDVDSVADVYAVFEGSDIHPRMTTCGNDCVNTIPLTTFR